MIRFLALAAVFLGATFAVALLLAKYGDVVIFGGAA